MEKHLSYLLMKICISLTLILLGCISEGAFGVTMVITGILWIPLAIHHYIKLKLAGETDEEFYR